MDCETIPLSRLAANLQATLDDCLFTGRTVVVEMPGHGLVAIKPLTGRSTEDYPGADSDEDDDDDLVDRLIANNPAFRAMLERSDASGRVPMDMELEPED